MSPTASTLFKRPTLGICSAICSTLALIAVACGSGDPQATTPAPAPAAGEDSATTTTLASNGDRAVNEPPAAPADPEPPSQPSGTSETTAPEDPPASASTTTSQPELATETTAAPASTTTSEAEPPAGGGEPTETPDDEGGLVDPADLQSRELCEAAGFAWMDESSECVAGQPYDAPGNLKIPQPLPPGRPGEIIDSELLETSEGIQGYRILYHSRSLRGQDIAVSGFAAIPTGDAPEGGWPLVAWAHGTTGMADICAPSQRAEANIAQFAPLIAAGYAVVATDYEGLGTPGIHPYIVGGSEARGVLDSVRAVQSMPELSVSNDFVVWGHSQGGHAALHAGQAWQEYASELNLLGVVSGAPPSQFSLIYNVLAIGPYRGYLLMAMAAFAEAYEEADLRDVLTPEAIAELDFLEQACIEEVLAKFATVELRDLQTVDNPLSVPPWNDLAQQNDVNQKPIQAPVLIVHGGSDAQVPALSSQFLVGQICPLPGQGPVQRIEYPGEGHSSVIPVYFSDMMAWMQARFADEEAPDTCARG